MICEFWTIIIMQYNNALLTAYGYLHIETIRSTNMIWLERLISLRQLRKSLPHLSNFFLTIKKNWSQVEQTNRIFVSRFIFCFRKRGDGTQFRKIYIKLFFSLHLCIWQLLNTLEWWIAFCMFVERPFSLQPKKFNFVCFIACHRGKLG